MNEFIIMKTASPLVIPLMLCVSLQLGLAVASSRHSFSFKKSLKDDFKPLPNVDCSSSPQSGYFYCQSSKEFMARAEDLVSKLTLDEVINQTTARAPGIPRLGIKDYNWRSNCLHGWTLSGGNWPEDFTWTVFPSPIGLAATFNASLIRDVGSVTGVEGRALHNEMLTRNNGSSTEAAGLNCYSPNVNLFRDPRWGRGQETFGEDPYLISVIGAAYTNGLQWGKDKKYLLVGACAKHYAVHSGPEETRHSYAPNVSLHDLYDTYLPAFKSQALGAKVAQIMPALSGVNCSKQPDEAPDAANAFLLKTVFRDEFASPNVSTCSDNEGVVAVYSGHHYVNSTEMAAAVSINATTDLDLGYDLVYPNNLKAAVDDGLVDETVIRESVTRSFYLRMLVGDFDPPEMVPYQYLDKTYIDTDENQALNLQATRESIVLLKNDQNSLPISSSQVKRVVVLGPNANDSYVLLSNYQGIPSRNVTILQGIQNHLADTSAVVEYAPVCDIFCNNTSKFLETELMVARATYVIMVMGLSGEVEGESKDRKVTRCEGEDVPLLGLPGCQERLVKGIAKINPSVILILVNGGPVSIPDLVDNHGVKGIIEAFYPGPLGGTAVADVIFGRYNPGGRMPVTTYLSDTVLPPFESYDMTTPPGRTYRYYSSDKPPLFPFGFGLSYSEFKYSNLTLSTRSVKPCDNLAVSVVVSTDDMDGDEVVLMFLLPHPNSSESFPIEELIGFNRVHVTKGTPQKVNFDINSYLLSLVGQDGVHYIYPGEYTLRIGSKADKHAITENFSITGSAPVKTSNCKNSPQCLAC